MKSTRLATLLFLLLLSLSMAACASSKQASSGGTSASAPTGRQTSQASFPEKEIKIIVPYKPGGGFDIAARLIAPFLEKYLPNDATVVVENMPGGESNIALAHVTKAKPDGYTLAIVNLPGHAVRQILGEADYDLTKFEYLGRITDASYVSVAGKNSGLNSFEDFKGKEILTSITDVSASGTLGMMAAAKEMGFTLKMVNTGDGSQENLLAIIRGDAHWMQTPVESIQGSLNNDIKPLWIYSEQRHPSMPDVPTVKELGYEQLLATVSIHRALASTPGTPKETMDILRTAFEKAVHDPEFQAKLVNTGNGGNPATPEETLKLAKIALEQFAPMEQILKDARKK